MNLYLRIKHILSFFIILLFSSLTIAQTAKGPASFSIIEYNILPFGASKILTLNSKVSYQNLVFIKQENHFVAGYSIEYTLRMDNTVIDRKVTNKTVTSLNFEHTIDENYFGESSISFEVQEGDITIYPILTINNTDRSILLDSIRIEISEVVKNGIYFPIVIDKLLLECENINSFRLVNNQNTIPFSNQSIQLLIPVEDSLKSISSIKVEQNGKEIINYSNIEFNNDRLKIVECKNGIGISVDDAVTFTKYFIIENFSNKLKEGPAKIVIEINNEVSIKHTLLVKWNNKPFSLSNIELALEILEAVIGKDQFSKHFNGKKKEQHAAFMAYWDNFLPNRENEFNELMNEFYSRADYTLKNFSTVNMRNGAKSDRGITYIKYGKPDEIIRDYSGKRVIEIWNYNNLNRQFIFSDNTGLGNFKLES